MLQTGMTRDGDLPVKRSSAVMRCFFVAALALATGCATSSTSGFDVDDWSNEILDCIGQLQEQYPNADRTRMWVVCEDEFWSDKQVLLGDLCADDPNFASCDYRR
jgi:hypothetical protein